MRDRFRKHLQITNLTASQLTSEQKEFKKSYLQGRRTLEHEFGKTMRYKSIRELVDGDAGQVIHDLKPVWLSIGVIAFSEAQQDEIEVALNRLASEDEEFRRLLQPPP